MIVEAFGVARGSTNKELPRDSRWSEHTEISSVTIGYMWMLSHAYFTVAMFLTFFVTSNIGRMLLVASVGISWAITLWAPYCLIGVVLSRRQRLDCQDIPETGAVMGLHNAAISAPQVFSALICSTVFALFSGAEAGVIWALRIGGCWTVVAIYLSWKLTDELEFS